MKILKQEKLPKSQTKLEIEISKEELEKFFDKAAKKFSETVKISGFRPGKAPRKLVEKEVGDKRFQEEALQIAIPETFLDALEETKILSIASPDIKVQKFVPTDKLVYEAIVTTVPEIKLPDYKKLLKESKIKMVEPKVEEKQVDDVLNNFKKQFAEYKPVLRKAQKGDKVEIDFDAFVSGQALEGGSSKNHPLVLGEGMMVAGFEDQIVGMEKGTEKNFSLVFPKDYFKAELREKMVEFKVKLNELSETKLPEMNDEFAKKFGKKNMAELRETIKKDLTAQSEQNEKMKFEGTIINLVAEKTSVELPDAMIHDELHNMINDFGANLAAQGLTLEQYLTQVKKTNEEFENDMKPEAEKRIKIGLLLAKIAQDEKIESSEKEIDNEVKKIIASQQDKEEAEKKFNNENYKRYVKNVMANRKVVLMLVELAQNK